MEEALSKAQRLKKGQQMKRMAKKIALKKKIAAKKMASPEKLKDRAMKAARTLLLKKLTKGRDKSELSVGEKEKFEKALSKKKGAINKIAKKMLPKIKEKEKQRLAALKSGSEE